MSLLPKSIKLGVSKTYNKSSKRLSESIDSIDAKVIGLVNSVVEFSEYQGEVTDTKNVAKFQLEFPSLETDYNTISFSLLFNNRTVDYIATEIALYNLTTNLPSRKDSAIAKWILSPNVDADNKPVATPVHDEKGQPIYRTLDEFSTFKLTRSTQKLYSILCENKLELDLDNLQESITGQTITVKTYYNPKIKDYTICSPSYVPQTDNASPSTTTKPRAKKYGVRARTQAGSTW